MTHDEEFIMLNEANIGSRCSGRRAYNTADMESGYYVNTDDLDREFFTNLNQVKKYIRNLSQYSSWLYFQVYFYQQDRHNSYNGYSEELVYDGYAKFGKIMDWTKKR